MVAAREAGQPAPGNAVIYVERDMGAFMATVCGLFHFLLSRRQVLTFREEKSNSGNRHRLLVGNMSAE